MTNFRRNIFPLLSVLSLLAAGTASADLRKPNAGQRLPGLALREVPAPPKAGETPLTKLSVSPAQVLTATSLSGNALGLQIQTFLQSNPSALGGTVMPALRLDYTQIVKGAAGLSDMAYVRFIQTYQGLDVMDSQVVVSVHLNSQAMYVDNVEGRVFPDIQIPAARALAAPSAMNQARTSLGRYATQANLRPLGRRVRWLRRKWRIVQEFQVKDLGVRAAVDEASGQVELWDARHYVTYNGDVKGRIVLFDPQATGAALPSVPFKELAVQDGIGNVTYTDVLGNYTLSTPSHADLPITLSGQWGEVNDKAAAPLQTTIANGSASPVHLLFNASANDELKTAQTNGYYHENFIHDWIVSKGVNPAGIDTVLPVYVNWPATDLFNSCNAFYDDQGLSINFFQSGFGCINSAYDTVIYHEYGHFIDDAIGGIPNDGLSEGWGDTVATYATGQPILGEGFTAGDPSSSVRTADNSYSYSPLDESHTQGTAWAGFNWDLRKNFIALLGSPAGIALAENLVMPTFFANSLDIPAAVRAVAVRDSPTGQIKDAPHLAQLVDAANKHGLGYALDIQAPTVPTGLNAPLVNPKSFTLAWTASTDDIGVVGYALDLSTSPTFSPIWPPYNKWNFGNVTQASVTGLSPDTTFYARLNATDEAGNSSPNSLSLKVVTLPGDAVPPTVAITFPTTGASLAGVVAMSGTAADNLLVSSVTVSVDGVLLGKATGTTAWSFSLDTGFLSNGPHILTVKAYDFSDNAAAADISVNVFNLGQAVYSAALKVPACLTPGPQCTSGALLLGRGAIAGGPELNAPNTLQSACADGNFGTYHLDESNDRLRVSTLDGSDLAPGKTVKIEATVWSYTLFSDDFLDLYYAADAANPVWVYLTTLNPTSAGAQTLSTTYTLPAGGLQAVRARFRFIGAPGSCGVSIFDDHDDLAFTTGVSGTADTTPPQVAIASPHTGATLSGIISISGSASDNIGLLSVTILAEGTPIGTAAGTTAWNFSLDTRDLANGNHTLTAQATDFSGNIASTTVSVSISNTQQPAVYDPTLKAPACASASSLCDSANLLNSRGAIGGASEPNHPNTIHNSCADGNSGNYHSDESNDRLRVLTLDGSVMAPGKTVRVEATVWSVGGNFNSLDLYYTSSASNPVWIYLTTLFPQGTHQQILSTTYVLPGGSVQAVRARFREFGVPAACGLGVFDDVDDLVFTVGGLPDTFEPGIAILSPQPVTGSVFNNIVDVSVNAIDNVGVTKVELYVDQVLIGNRSAAPFNFSWDTTRLSNGFHSMTAKAYDAAGNIGIAEVPRILTFNVANIGTDAAAGAPAPVVHVPNTLPLNGGLTAGYDPSFGAVNFVWEFDPLTGSPATPAFAQPSVSGIPNATWTTSNSLSLSSLHLTPNRYHVWIAAIFPDGSVSTSAQADVSLIASGQIPVLIRPNPWRAARGDPPMIFEQMPTGSTIKIYTIAAEWIRTLDAASGTATWDLKDDDGKNVASGIYLYLITDNQNNKSHGKLGVIR